MERDTHGQTSRESNFMKGRKGQRSHGWEPSKLASACFMFENGCQFENSGRRELWLFNIFLISRSIPIQVQDDSR